MFPDLFWAHSDQPRGDFNLLLDIGGQITSRLHSFFNTWRLVAHPEWQVGLRVGVVWFGSSSVVAPVDVLIDVIHVLCSAQYA